MRRNHRQAQLFLNGRAVGTVDADGFSDGWGFGEFTPDSGFSDFALAFGTWGMLIHEDDDQAKTSKDALAALRETEATLDGIKAELVWTDTHERTRLRQITIDGRLIEWRQEQMPSSA